VPSFSCEPASNGGVIWLGGRQAKGVGKPGTGWFWVTGESWDFQNWAAGEPNDYGGFTEDRLVCFLGDGTWNDQTDSSPSSPPCVDGLVVEWSADCNDDGVVDYGQVLLGELADVNGNNVPDTCELDVDCNLNGLRDTDEIDSGRAFDSDGDGAIDSCTAQDPLPVVRSIGINRGPSCGWWTTALFPEIWDLWVSRTSPEGPWLNGGVASGDSLRLEMELQPGVNTLSMRHEFNGCSSAVWGFGIWFENSVSPQIRIKPGEPCLPYDGVLNSTLDQSSVNGGGIVTARSGRWRVTATSLTIALGSDLVDAAAFTPSGTADLVSTLTLSVSPICFGDISGNGTVDGIDLAAVLGAWGTSGKGEFPADVNGDGTVDGSDLAIVLGGWGPCPE
jgi:hypothetical protein